MSSKVKIAASRVDNMVTNGLGFRIRVGHILISSLLLLIETLGKLFLCFVPWFPYLSNGDNRDAVKNKGDVLCTALSTFS